MNTRAKYIVTGVFICAALSFVGVSCMQFFGGKGREVIIVDELDLVQTREPAIGDVTAVIKTSLGDIKTVLYPQYAPKTVEIFRKLAESGYYDNTYIFNSEPGVYFAAGSPNKNGDLDESKPEGTEECELEIDDNLWPFRGALCSLSTGESGGWWDKFTGDSKIMNGSRFTILNSADFTDDFKKELIEANEDKTLAQKFIQFHGVPALSQQLTVFGQTYDGFDVIDKLTSLETTNNEEGLKIPVEDIMIKTIEIGTYSESDKWTAKQYPTESITDTTNDNNTSSGEED